MKVKLDYTINAQPSHLAFFEPNIIFTSLYDGTFLIFCFEDNKKYFSKIMIKEFAICSK